MTRLRLLWTLAAITCFCVGCAPEVSDEDALASLRVTHRATIGPSGEAGLCGVEVCVELSADGTVDVDDVVIHVDVEGVVEERMFGPQTVGTEPLALCNAADGPGTHAYRIDIVRGAAVRTESGMQAIACDPPMP
jgi:hypothetical protein